MKRHFEPRVHHRISEARQFLTRFLFSTEMKPPYKRFVITQQFFLFLTITEHLVGINELFGGSPYELSAPSLVSSGCTPFSNGILPVSSVHPARKSNSRMHASLSLSFRKDIDRPTASNRVVPSSARVRGSLPKLSRTFMASSALRYTARYSAVHPSSLRASRAAPWPTRSLIMST